MRFNRLFGNSRSIRRRAAAQRAARIFSCETLDTRVLLSIDSVAVGDSEVTTEYSVDGPHQYSEDTNVQSIDQMFSLQDSSDLLSVDVNFPVPQSQTQLFSLSEDSTPLQLAVDNTTAELTEALPVDVDRVFESADIGERLSFAADVSFIDAFLEDIQEEATDESDESAVDLFARPLHLNDLWPSENTPQSLNAQGDDGDPVRLPEQDAVSQDEDSNGTPQRLELPEGSSVADANFDLDYDQFFANLSAGILNQDTAESLQ